jgi:hypothetical protein
VEGFTISSEVRCLFAWSKRAPSQKKEAGRWGVVRRGVDVRLTVVLAVKLRVGVETDRGIGASRRESGVITLMESIRALSESSTSVDVSVVPPPCRRLLPKPNHLPVVPRLSD